MANLTQIEKEKIYVAWVAWIDITIITVLLLFRYFRILKILGFLELQKDLDSVKEDQQEIRKMQLSLIQSNISLTQNLNTIQQSVTVNVGAEIQRSTEQTRELVMASPELSEHINRTSLSLEDIDVSADTRKELTSVFTFLNRDEPIAACATLRAAIEKRLRALTRTNK